MENMKWEKASPKLGMLLESALKDCACQKKMMFGAPVYTVNGNMFTGVHGSNIFLRLSESDRQKITAEYKQARPFEPVKGHVMKEYVVAPEELYDNETIFWQWLKRAFDYASSLKPKESRKSGKSAK